MPAFDPENIDSALRDQTDREFATVLIQSFRDYVAERAICEVSRGPISTYTFFGETEQQIAIVHGICPAPDDETILVVHNEIKPNPDTIGERLASLAAWTINKSFIGYRQEVVHHDEDEAWEMPMHVPLIQNYPDENTDGETALHLHMNSHVMNPIQSVSFGNSIRPSVGTLNFLIRGYQALNLCTEATYNENVKRLA